ncbi:MAG: phosphatidylglycerophosphatase A [Elusimicrobia bacterium]|nr:phosphatidylglycerophosphatase A [Elusimicrobiota bacterium]
MRAGPGAGRFSVAVATCLYLSYIPAKLTAGSGWAERRRWTGAGFLGTLAGWGSWYALPADPAAYAAVVAVLIWAACAVCGAAERELGGHDDPRIVLDETVGFWVAAAFLPAALGWQAASFALFRLLDAVKLPPYRWLERLPGGYGVVMDDVGAGLAANLILQLAAAFLK